MRMFLKRLVEPAKSSRADLVNPADQISKEHVGEFCGIKKIEGPLPELRKGDDPHTCGHCEERDCKPERLVPQKLQSDEAKRYERDECQITNVNIPNPFAC